MTNINPSSAQPPVEFTQEIRFAVVMYGGSSLCVYMNGVAQELLRLVRATAPDPADKTKAYLPGGSDKLGGSGQIYRKLGAILSRGDNSLEHPSNGALRTRFVIDVLSGTSAGGINSVYLAKALANDQDLSELKRLWIETADIDVLMNDNQSSTKTALAPQAQPRSLFNSRLMYYMLLDALMKMDQADGSSGSKPERSPYVDELDLYTTATDIKGRKIRIRLADGVANERRHLNSFHFHYHAAHPHENQFAAKYNPFLAFAARCTSAHPVPFEPVMLSDIDEALTKMNLNVRSDNKDWQTFYEDYLQPFNDPNLPSPTSGSDAVATRDRLAESFRQRPFNDGGVLDNSPFSFVIDSLQFRHSDLPVDRKLLYVEPVPEHPEEELDSMQKPDAFETGWLALSVLPRYQFIREDLERLLERNRLVERVNRILRDVEGDEIERLREDQRRADQAGSAPPRPLNAREFGEMDLRKMIGLMGSAWGGYQRLRVAETTDELTMMITQAAGFNEKSDELLALRYLVRTWRTQNYDAYREGFKGCLRNDEKPSLDRPPVPKDSENQFLFRYDLKWRLRRLKFVIAKIDQIVCFDRRAQEILEITRGLDIKEMPNLINDPQAQEEFRREAQTIRRKLSDVLGVLYAVRRLLFSNDEENPLSGGIKMLAGIGLKELRQILEQPTDSMRERVAEELLSSKAADFGEFVKVLDNALRAPMKNASMLVSGNKDKTVEGILEVPDGAQSESSSAPSINLVARQILKYFYENFDRYDMISYPLLYATNVGEEVDTVEVFRISPEDAGHLVDTPEKRRLKLAGTSLGNFGAFFDVDFRRNDILWGRLDAAERIVTALLSSVPAADPEERKRLEAELIRDAQRAILAEEFISAEDKAGLRGLLGAALAETKSEEDNIAFREKLKERLTGGEPDLSKMQAFLTACLKGTDPLLDFRDTYKPEHTLAPRVLIRNSARASRVFGKMLEGVADKHRIEKKRVVWVTRLAQLFWSLVEVAVPGSLGNLIAHHFVKLLYVFEALMVVGGTLLLNKPVQQFGFLAFGITVVFHIAVLLLGDAMVTPPPDATVTPPLKKSRKRRFIFPVVLILLPVFAFGLIFLLGVMGVEFAFQILQKAIAPDPPGWNLKTLLRVAMLLPVLYAGLWAIVYSISEFRRSQQKQSPKS